MRFSSLGMTTTTHLRCTDGIVAALISHPMFQSNESLIRSAKEQVLGHKSKWAYAYHLPKKDAKKTLTQRIPEIIRRQQSTGMWKRKNAEIFSYGILRALKHADLLNQIQFHHDPYKSFRDKTDLISVLVQKNIMGDIAINVEEVANPIFTDQSQNGSWHNSLSATCFQLQTLIELGFGRKHSEITRSIDWIFESLHESMHWRQKKYEMLFRNVFYNTDVGAEEQGFKRVVPEFGPTGCILHHAAMSSAVALYTLTRLGYEENERVLDGYKHVYNLRGIHEKNGEIRDEVFWCACMYKSTTTYYAPKKGIKHEDYLRIVTDRMDGKR